MTSELLASIVGVALSLIFSYIPGVKDWYDRMGMKPDLSEEENDKRNRAYKQMVMGLLLIGTTCIVFGLACGGVIEAVTCDKVGALGLAKVLLAALIANQSTYLITRR